MSLSQVNVEIPGSRCLGPGTTTRRSWEREPQSAQPRPTGRKRRSRGGKIHGGDSAWSTVTSMVVGGARPLRTDTPRSWIG
ncbi:hypothetical protein GDO86_020044 [Hymenochirus boettgeri]|uniref:Uncharacterized protein n=1 Tax=Hymenochirus boettgeri TaxID=247094 RepID=A0A8T2IDV9_9PIPI|nr:hypothetical protein GDO86_020044 [Hymenochirus boettgeri]